MNIWSDHWIPWLKKKTPTGLIGVSTSEIFKVAELIDEDSKCWQMDVLDAYFTLESGGSIEKISLPRTEIIMGGKQIWEIFSEKRLPIQ